MLDVQTDGHAVEGLGQAAFYNVAGCLGSISDFVGLLCI